ncbi:MAG TPA: alpha/beta hydrolase [Acidimicrobiia bacterium]|nr:alpha/beta hydrolase [Acidimicrobiia bacterium]
MRQGTISVTWAGIDGAEPLEVAYLEAGPADGPLALCLHGFPDHAPTWTALLGDLAAAGFHAVAPWMRGYAPTAVPADGRYQPAALVLDALALADALHPGGGAVVIGHDWGAWGALGAAVQRPGQFRRLVTLAAPHQAALAARMFTSPVQLKRSWYTFFFQLPIAEMAVAAFDFRLIDRLWADWSPGYAVPPDFMKTLKETLGASGSLEAVLGYYRHTLNPLNQDPALAGVQASLMGPVPVPTLHLHGADDGCIGAELVHPEELEPFYPAGLEVEIVPGVGHFLHLEDPARVNRRIVDFVTAP